jgi:hypothetical protein
MTGDSKVRLALAQITDSIAVAAEANPGRVLLAVVAELVDAACGTNPALKDFMRLQMYRRIARRLE